MYFYYIRQYITLRYFCRPSWKINRAENHFLSFFEFWKAIHRCPSEKILPWPRRSSIPRCIGENSPLALALLNPPLPVWEKSYSRRNLNQRKFSLLALASLNLALSVKRYQPLPIGEYSPLPLALLNPPLHVGQKSYSRRNWNQLILIGENSPLVFVREYSHSN